jgi:hypothetical protein
MYIKTAYNRSDTVTATEWLRYGYGCWQESEQLLYNSESIKFPEKVKNGTMEKVENSC